MRAGGGEAVEGGVARLGVTVNVVWLTYVTESD